MGIGLSAQSDTVGPLEAGGRKRRALNGAGDVVLQGRRDEGSGCGEEASDVVRELEAMRRLIGENRRLKMRMFCMLKGKMHPEYCG